MRRLSNLERRVLRYHGQPANVVAVAERLAIDDVLETRMQLRRRGVVASTPGLHEPEPEQLSLDDVDHMMRTNRSPAEPLTEAP